MKAWLTPRQKAHLWGMVYGAIALCVIGAVISTYEYLRHSVFVSNSDSVKTKNLVPDSPLSQAHTASEVVGVITAFYQLSTRRDDSENPPPSLLAPHERFDGIRGLLTGSANYPVPKSLSESLDYAVANRAYFNAMHYYAQYRYPAGGALTDEERNYFNDFTVSKGLEKKWADDAAYLALAAMDASYQAYPLTDSQAKQFNDGDLLPALATARNELSAVAKIKFARGYSLSSTLGALAALISYDQGYIDERQSKLASTFVADVFNEPADVIDGGLFARAFDLAEIRLREFSDGADGALSDRVKRILVYQILDALAQTEDPDLSLHLAKMTADYWGERFNKKVERNDIILGALFGGFVYHEPASAIFDRLSKQSERLFQQAKRKYERAKEYRSQIVSQKAIKKVLPAVSVNDPEVDEVRERVFNELKLFKAQVADEAQLRVARAEKEAELKVLSFEKEAQRRELAKKLDASN